MNERAVFAYRLTLELSEECRSPDYVPDVLAEREQWRDWEATPFKWPRRRLYFSWEAAQRRASMLRSWGATVRVERARVDDWQPVVMWWEQHDRYTEEVSL